MLLIFDTFKENFTLHSHSHYNAGNMLISRCRFAKNGGDTDQIFLNFARAVSLFCSLTPLFGGVLHDLATVVFLFTHFSITDRCVERKEKEYWNGNRANVPKSLAEEVPL